MLDIKLVYGSIDSVNAEHIICPLDRAFHVLDSACELLVTRVEKNHIFESSLHEKRDSGVTVIRMEDPVITDRILYFPVFWGSSGYMIVPSCLNLSKTCESIALPLCVLSTDHSEIDRRLKRIFSVLFSDHPLGAGKLKQVTLVTTDRYIFETAQVLLQAFEDQRKKREAEKLLCQKEYALRRSIDRQKLKDCIIFLLNCDKITHSSHVPDYPNALFDVFQLMDVDSNYGEHVSEIQKHGMKPNELSALQIQSYLTYLNRGVHWDLHMLAEHANNGVLLRVLFRLYELVCTESTHENWI